MSNDDNSDLQKRIENLEKDLKRVKSHYEKSIKYKRIEPEIALHQARVSVEAICRQIYINAGMEKGAKPADKMRLEELITRLSSKGIFPKKIAILIRTVQHHGNFGSHDQGDESDDIGDEFVNSCLSALSTVVEWYFYKYHQKPDLLHSTVQPVSESVSGQDSTAPVNQKGPTSQGKKVPAYEKIRNAMESFGDGYIASYGDIMDYCNKEYGETKKSTFRTYIISCTVNHGTRVHYHPNKKPRTEIADSDVLYQVEKGKVVLYEPDKHGKWIISLNDQNKLVVENIS